MLTFFKQRDSTGSLVPDDVAAEIENRDFQQALIHEVQKVEDTAGTAIAINERMNGLKLIVHDGEPDEGSTSSASWMKRSQLESLLRSSS